MARKRSDEMQDAEKVLEDAFKAKEEREGVDIETVYDPEEDVRKRLAVGPADGWRPEPGDEIVGALVNLDMSGPSEYNAEGYPILTIEPKDGTPVAVHCFHTVLWNEVKKNQPQVGDTVGIIYHGEKEEAGYASYSVAFSRARGAAFDWSSAPAPKKK